MTTTLPISLGEQQHIVLDGVSWETYEQILRDLQDRPIRVTYDGGNIEMMAPLEDHEEWKKHYARLIETMCDERDLVIVALGSTTFRRKDLKKAIEPDECYYVQHAEAIRMRRHRRIDLTIDPPPDLAIEIDIFHASIPKQPIYAAMGIPELWRFDGTRLTVLSLRDEKYGVSDSSSVFPFLPMEQFQQYVVRLASERQPSVMREFRDWVRKL